MADLYAPKRATATRLLTKWKQGELKLKREIPGSTSPPYSPFNPGPPTTETYDLVGTARGVGTKYVDGTLILATDRQATIAVPPVEPLPSDKISVDGKDHTIIHVKRIPEAGTSVAFIVFFRA